ncbi:hypothetical protein [Sediminibacillus halophilus]|uniref:Uncharacterized protein n=1 Tax=Sediminibacillus halophilus TaxID=482461 RepID=A0A1G9R302_9BACI|nr:hypothetical protein [Sediminibacillus halophilus]SDM17629.1 hypothetical protein SAMN05216244_1792 [Sediminibacillus halophilus]
MFQVYILFFFAGVVMVTLSLYLRSGERRERYSWLSYISPIIPIVLMTLLLFYPRLPADEYPSAKVIPFVLLVGSPIGLILSIFALFKKKEKNILAIAGLFLSLLLVGTLTIFGIFVTSYTP